MHGFPSLTLANKNQFSAFCGKDNLYNIAVYTHASYTNTSSMILVALSTAMKFRTLLFESVSLTKSIKFRRHNEIRIEEKYAYKGIRGSEKYLFRNSSWDNSWKSRKIIHECLIDLRERIKQQYTWEKAST